MKKFFDAVKVNLLEDTERYFLNVEVESVKRGQNDTTLNFYIVSKDLIPYKYLKDAENEIARQLFNINTNLQRNPVHIFVRYELSKSYDTSLIFEEIKEDLFKELKGTNRILATIFNNTKFSFNDKNLDVIFDDSEAFKDEQNELLLFIISVYKERFGIDLNSNVKYEKMAEKKFAPSFYYNENERMADRKTIDVEDIKSIENKLVDGKNDNNEKVKSATVKPKRSGWGFNEEGDILYGRLSKQKYKTCDIKSIHLAPEGISVKIVATILNFDIRDTKKGKTIFNVSVNDNTSTIMVKIWGEPENKKIFYDRFKVGDVIEICGRTENDAFAHTYTIHPYSIKKTMSRKIIEYGHPGDSDYYNVVITDRKDNEKEKRVELHLHTKSSARDAIGEVNAYIETAKKWGMKAMAITDHGSVNALPDAYEYVLNLKKKNKGKFDFKIINGLEGYLVDDFEIYYFDKNGNRSDTSHKLDDVYVVYDFVTTGYNPKKDAVVKIEAKKISGYNIIETFSEYVKHDKPLSFELKSSTGMRDSDVITAKTLKEVLIKFNEFGKNAVYVTTNKNSTWKLSDLYKENNIDIENSFLDMTIVARLTLPNMKLQDLFSIANELKITIKGLTDKKKEEKKKGLLIHDKIELASYILVSLFKKLEEEYNVTDLFDLHDTLKINNEFIKRQKYYHIILLAKNDAGRVNLYKLVSESHINYMYRRPRIPRSLLVKYREGLILGSACIAGEFMTAIRDGRSDAVLKEIASFYDYLEIQPAMNNSFLLREDPENFKTVKDLEELNKKVIEIGDILKKPVVATCDCHYVEKEDKIDRAILQFGTMFKKTNLDKDGKIKEEASSEQEASGDEELYFRNTREMLDEFSYLGVDKAYEVVVKNTNLINNMIEDIIPVRLDKCPPNIEGSDDILRNACNENLKKLYGDKLPKDSPIVKRLENELKYIIDNGYSVMYIAAKKLIEFSKENGFPVGSRGSVGSSLAATLSGVSEVNPLVPHYVCPMCHHLEYNTEETRKFNNESGFDMPDKKCPKCGTLMKKDGVNIPFETFLGIPGVESAQKEPDIDLNFCSAFQNNIHEYTVDLFGRENTYKAGTVGTVASKTAYGYVMRYKENHPEFDMSKEDITYHVNKIVNCKNTSGQHPGGMIVVPKGEYIDTFTPIQYPADKEGDDITTHFDYHKINENLLKLDILGHDAPSHLKKLFEYTGVDYNTVPFYEKEVLELFKSTESLGIKPSDISGTKLGCLTIPEFRTDNAISMCEEAKPESISDLIRISGLAHGTDVWKNNVQDLIKSGDCTLKNAICCRDDIMLYLIDKGLDHGLAFNIMEKVRKGKGLTPEWEKEMRTHEVPEWYIGCCNKIKYMFPKAHAAAYVLAALRIGYYKVHYPLEYYAAYFSTRKDGFVYNLMMQTKEEIHYQIEKLNKAMMDKKSENGFSVKDEDLYMCYRAVEEMKARGVEFVPIDIYTAKASDFIIVGNKIMPSFDSIPGIGDEVAKKLEIEGKIGDYTSIENFKSRTGVSRTKIDEMKEMGLLLGLKEAEENTLFDLLK